MLCWSLGKWKMRSGMTAKRLSKVFLFMNYSSCETWYTGRWQWNPKISCKKRGRQLKNDKSNQSYRQLLILTSVARGNGLLKLLSQMPYLYVYGSTIQIRKFYFWGVQESSGVSSCPYHPYATKRMGYVILTQLLSAKGLTFLFEALRKRLRDELGMCI